MLKNILELNETQELSKKQQNKITGGMTVFDCSNEPDGTSCVAQSGNLRTCYDGVCYDC